MNSRKYDSQLDFWFSQAFEVYAQAKPSKNVWPRVISRLKSPLPGRWRRLLLQFSRPMMLQCPLTHQAVRGKDGKFSPSPFLPVMIKQVLDLRMAF
ncbi:MAG: hypothetical protein JXA21_30120 [Anaerolineae bacterium]|nr:hypothetical protein [Anaerolineae bacterium]